MRTFLKERKPKYVLLHCNFINAFIGTTTRNKDANDKSSHVLHNGPLRTRRKCQWYFFLCGSENATEFSDFFFPLLKNLCLVQLDQCCFATLHNFSVVRRWLDIEMRLASFFLMVPLLPPQARRRTVLSSMENRSMVDQQISYLDLQHCATAVDVGARQTAAQLLSVSIANNSNYRQAVRPHERCLHQSSPISCSDGGCSVSLLQHCHSYSAQDDSGWTALQKLVRQITANILSAIFIEESDAVSTEYLLGLFKSLGCFHEAQQELERIQVFCA